MPTALITGGGGSIGHAVAVELAASGYNIFLLGRTPLSLEDTAAVCVKVNPSVRVSYRATDCCDEEFAASAINECIEQYQTIDVFVHCVAKFELEAVFTPSSAANQLNSLVQTNLLSAVTCTRALVPFMLRARKGHIVFITSHLARLFPSSPGLAAFYTSMNGITALAQALWADCRHHGVHVSTLFLGLANSTVGEEMIRSLPITFHGKIKRDEIVQPSDVGKAVCFILQNVESNIMELHLVPQKDVHRLQVYKEVPKMNDLVAQLVGDNIFSDTRVALITGAGKGIGRSIAVEMAKEGFHLSLVARTLADLEETARECVSAARGCNISIFSADVAKYNEIDGVILSTVEKFNTISSVVSNAGTNRRKNSALASTEIWEDIMRVNLLGAMYLTRKALPHLLKHANKSHSKSSHLIFVNTFYSHPRQGIVPGIVPYASSKAALSAFANVVLEDVRDWGVKVSTIYPGLVATALGTKAGPVERRGNHAHAPMIPCLDIARAVSFIVNSPHYICVNEIHIDTNENDFAVIREHARNYIDQALAKL